MIMDDIERIETIIHSRNTIIVGDFNADPYEEELLFLKGFRTTMDKKIASRTKNVMGKKFTLMYNPMWNMYGDREEPCGTYRYNNSQIVNPVWYMFDQLLL